MDTINGGGKTSQSANSAKQARLSRMGLDTRNILDKRTSKPVTAFKPDTQSSRRTVKRDDPRKSERASLMPTFHAVMRDMPGVKLTSPERRRVLNSVIETMELPSDEEMSVSPSTKTRELIRENVHSIVQAKEQRLRKAMDTMELEDLIAGLTMSSRPARGYSSKRNKIVTALATEAVAQQERLARQASERAARHQRREELHNRLEYLRNAHNLDMDVDEVINGMDENRVNDALAMSEDDLIGVFRTMRFGGKKGKRSTRTA
jgi:hypothetical protein